MPGDCVSLPATQREGLRVLGDSKLPREGQQSQAKAPLPGQQRRTRPPLFAPQESSVERERAEMLSRHASGTSEGSDGRAGVSPRQPLSRSHALGPHGFALCPDASASSLPHSLLLGVLSGSPGH